MEAEKLEQSLDYWRYVFAMALILQAKEKYLEERSKKNDLIGATYVRAFNHLGILKIQDFRCIVDYIFTETSDSVSEESERWLDVNKKKGQIQKKQGISLLRGHTRVVPMRE